MTIKRDNNKPTKNEKKKKTEKDEEQVF